MSKKNEDLKKMWGYTDEAAIDDLFNIGSYIGGLSQFMLTCKTPMTISIQGSWGTGKTSVMNMIKKKLEEEKNVIKKCIWFNTWQFSQFNMDDELAVSLLKYLIDSFEMSKDESKRIKAGLNFLGKSAKEAMLIAVDKLTTGQVAATVENVMDTITDSLASQDPVQVLNGLKNDFASCVKKQVDEDENAKIVVFIDDLDRLEPKKAVEMLEVLKNFLDCKHCIFVLAIDYEVVVRGVEAKYGKLGNDEKGKSFFDKIIQVPFKMPVSSYDIKNYVKTCFEDIGFKIKDVSTYVRLIEKSIGTNPRTMKRLFNAYLLLSNIVPTQLMSDENKPLLFAILCLQHFNEDVYDYLVKNRESLTADILSDIEEGNLNEIEELDLSKEELDNINNFMGAFIDAIDIDKSSAGIDEKEWENFKKILGFSTITAHGSGEVDISSSKNFDKFIFMDDENRTEYNKSRLPHAVINRYYNENPGLTIDDLKEKFSWDKQQRLILPLEEIEEKHKRKFTLDTPIVIDGKEYAVWKSWGPANLFNDYLNKLKSETKYPIERIEK